MRPEEFTRGGDFWCGGRQWRCTDIGTRTVVAIRIDQVAVAGSERRTLDAAQAEAEGWFNGPPYAVAETVFDEDALEACSLTPDPEDSQSPPDDAAEQGGLRFDAYLPPSLAT